MPIKQEQLGGLPGIVSEKRPRKKKERFRVWYAVLLLGAPVFFYLGRGCLYPGIGPVPQGGSAEVRLCKKGMCIIYSPDLLYAVYFINKISPITDKQASNKPKHGPCTLWRGYFLIEEK